MIDGVPRPRSDRMSVPPRTRRPVERALAILEVLAMAPEGLSLSELARRAELPKTSVARVIGDLVVTGMVTQDRRLYIPGPRLMRLASGIVAPGVAMVRRLMIPYVTLLRDETGLDVAFATMRRGSAHFELPVYGPALAPVLATLPPWAPAHSTATGKVLLAYADPADPIWHSVASLPRYTDATITDPDALIQELMQIRRSGFATGRGEYLEGIDGVAVPVFGSRRRVVGALAVCGHTDEFDLPATGSLLHRIAGSASTAIRRAGFTEPGHR